MPGRRAGAPIPGRVVRRRRPARAEDSDESDAKTLMKESDGGGDGGKGARRGDRGDARGGQGDYRAGDAGAVSEAQAGRESDGPRGVADAGAGGPGAAPEANEEEEEEEDDEGAFDLEELRRAAEEAEERHVTSPRRGAGEGETGECGMRGVSDLEGAGGRTAGGEIGRASCRERVCQYV